MSKFRRVVKFLSEFYGISEHQAAEAALALFVCGTFDWRKL